MNKVNLAYRITRSSNNTFVEHKFKLKVLESKDKRYAKMLNNLTIIVYHAAKRSQIIGEVHLNWATLWFATSLAVSSPENHFIPKFETITLIYLTSFTEDLNAITRILYTKLKQLISSRPKVDCD